MIISHLKSFLRDELADVLPEIKSNINDRFSEYEPNKIYNFGDKNPDKTLYIINRNIPGGGLFSNVTFVLNELKICASKNFIPIIDMLNFPLIYNDLNPINGTENSWEYYFDHPTTYNLKDAYNSKNVMFSEHEFKIDRAEYKNYILE